MTDRSISEEIRRLTDLLNRHNHAYHVVGRPEVPDLEYDRLFDRLSSLEQAHPRLKRPDSPTLRVGSDLSSDLPEVPHTIPVLSLDKAYSDAEVSSWIDRSIASAGSDLSFVVEEKIDGISIVLYYESGVLARAVTRGNGAVGNDVTGNVRTIGAVPLSVPEPVDVAVRGEIYLPVDRFAEINRTLETPYANPRNLAAGAVRRIKSSEVASIPLTMFAYEIYLDQPEPGSGEQISDHLEALELLERYGFRRNRRVGLFSRTGKTPRELPDLTVGVFDDLPDYIRRATSERRSLDYEIDGLVVKVNELEVRDAMGYTGHHPRWAIAYKFESPEGVTVVEAIDVQVGRTGRITPVARVKPVSVGGTTISNVTLHNQEYVGLLELAIGDTVAVSRRGDVIPAIERVVEKNESGNTTWEIPELCPSCDHPLTVDGAHHFCRNRHCPAQVRGRLRFFAARDQMDIDYLGPETIDLLVDRGLVTELADLYRVTRADLIGLPGFGEKKASLVGAGIAASRDRPYRLVLPSLGIPEIGPKVTELLIDSGIVSIDQLFLIAEQDDVDRLIQIDGIGEKTADRIVSELTDPDQRARIEALRSVGLHFEAELPRKGDDDAAAQEFSGQNWCVTGSFDHFKPRDRAMAEVKKRGGVVTSGVSGKTTHLLAGEGAGGKLEKAKSVGATIVTEAEFLRMIGAES